MRLATAQVAMVEAEIAEVELRVQQLGRRRARSSKSSKRRLAAEGRRVPMLRRDADERGRLKRITPPRRLSIKRLNAGSENRTTPRPNLGDSGSGHWLSLVGNPRRPSAHVAADRGRACGLRKRQTTGTPRLPRTSKTVTTVRGRWSSRETLDTAHSWADSESRSHDAGIADRQPTGEVARTE